MCSYIRGCTVASAANYDSTADASVAKSVKSRTVVGARDVDADVDAAACLSERANAPRMTRAFDRIARAPSFDEGSERLTRAAAPVHNIKVLLYKK